MRLWHALAQPAHLIKHALAIICPSDSAKEDVIRFFGKNEKDVHVIPHGVASVFSDKIEPQDFGIRSRHKLPKRFALFVGTLEPRKNIQTALLAMREYRAISHDDLHFVMVGRWGWNTRTLRHELTRNDTKLWIHQLQNVSQQELPAIYRAAACLLWPSFYEGFGLPVLEAMASGTPIITSHTSSLPQVTDGAAIHVDPYNHRDIAVALKELLSSPSLEDRLRREGLLRASRFSWETTARATPYFFQKTL